MLQNAYKLANGYCLQRSFIETDYRSKKKKFLKKFKTMKCGNCDIKYDHEIPLKPCTSCMKVQFCSKKCQKLHWNCGHNKICDKEWERLDCVVLFKQNEQGLGYSDNNRKGLGIELKSNDCEKHSEYERDCDKCIPYYLQVVDTYKYIDKVKNGDDIIAPKCLTLKIHFPLRRPFYFEIKRSKEITKKELMKTVYNSYKHIYKEEDETTTEYREDPFFYNRGSSNGKYGIGGWHLHHLT